MLIWNFFQYEIKKLKRSVAYWTIPSVNVIVSSRNVDQARTLFSSPLEVRIEIKQNNGSSINHNGRVKAKQVYDESSTVIFYVSETGVSVMRWILEWIWYFGAGLHHTAFLLCCKFVFFYEDMCDTSLLSPTLASSLHIQFSADTLNPAYYCWHSLLMKRLCQWYCAQQRNTRELLHKLLAYLHFVFTRI